jgi:hypothetical protein
MGWVADESGELYWQVDHSVDWLSGIPYAEDFLRVNLAMTPEEFEENERQRVFCISCVERVCFDCKRCWNPDCTQYALAILSGKTDDIDAVLLYEDELHRSYLHALGQCDECDEYYCRACGNLEIACHRCPVEVSYPTGTCADCNDAPLERPRNRFTKVEVADELALKVEELRQVREMANRFKSRAEALRREIVAELGIEEGTGISGGKVIYRYWLGEYRYLDRAQLAKDFPEIVDRYTTIRESINFKTY